ncbi:hypothetical protein TRIUR3_04712 [Triticum urartu]|uniref:Uncharacterized protein n=1 Tax=Triticum urartu TaxID=4572 RepID=M8A0V4_TRIUA|nr:hypothetical protein TRIUR3_04712 [Triticum urartu]
MEVDAVHEMEEIPCFARKDFLKKIGIAKSAFTQVTTPLQTKEGFTFFVNVINEQDTTYFTGRYRKQFLELYRLWVSIDTTFGTTKTWEDIGHANKFIKHIQNPDDTFVLFLHTFMKTNIKKKLPRLPKSAMPSITNEAGFIKIILDPTIEFTLTLIFLE